MKKLTPKQRNEVVTKGFLVDNGYLTKDYLDQRLKEQSSEFLQRLEFLTKHQMNQLQIFMEQMDERYVLRKKWWALK